MYVSIVHGYEYLFSTEWNMEFQLLLESCAVLYAVLYTLYHIPTL